MEVSRPIVRLEPKDTIKKTREYSAFETASVFGFDNSEKKSKNLLERVLHRAKIALRYTKKGQQLILAEHIQKEIFYDEVLHFLFKSRATQGHLVKVFADLPKKCDEYTAYEVFSLVPLMTDYLPVYINNFTSSFRQALEMTKKSDFKFAFCLGKNHAGPNHLVWKTIEKICEEVALQRFQWKINLKELSFLEEEKVSAYEALTLIPKYDFEPRTNTRGTFFLECIKMAIAAVKDTQLQYLYDLLKYQIYPLQMDGKNIHMHKLSYILEKMSKYGTKMPDLILKTPSTRNELVPVADIVKIVTRIKNCKDVLGILNLSYYTSRMVDPKDVKFLYCLLMGRIIATSEKCKKYYLDDVKFFKENLKTMIYGEKNHISGCLVERLCQKIDRMHDPLDEQVKYPALLVAELVPTVNVALCAKLKHIADSIKHTLHFVYPDEEDLLNVLVQKKIRQGLAPIVSQLSRNGSVIDNKLADTEHMLRSCGVS